ncbi:restriction endonuclease subunit S [Luteolibacter marinus]|uniref:restriction endonuclease subunit S n=1 Tax=Luteolibacter marinus TaxID=2776705 RepID=UPI0018680664|nr:restriction endonuclease subunit S [Luteolibacter marinus]
MSVPLDIFSEEFGELVNDLDAIDRIRGLALETAISPRSWPQLALEATTLKITDGAHKTPRYVESGVPFVSVKDFSGGRLDMSDTRFITEEEHAALFRRCDPRLDDILLGRIGTLGKAVVVDVDCEFSLFVSAALIRPDHSKIGSRFLQLVLNSPDTKAKFDAVKVGGATHTNKINLKDLRSILIPVPPLPEQKRIVAKVDALMAQCDRLEAQLRERDTRQSELARAALARFTEFPTPANLQLLFHDSFTLTPADLRKTILTLAALGKLVPKQGAWESLSLSDAAAEIVDCPHSTPKWTNEGKICVRTNQFRPGHLDLTASRFVSEKTYLERVQRLKPREDDILYSREGGILGVACRVPSGTEICLGQRMMLIRTGKTLVPAFLEQVLNSPFITEVARSRTTGGAAPRVNVSTVKAYSIPIPPLAEQRRIVAKVDQLMALVDEWEARLTATRTTATRLLDALVAKLTTEP